MVFSCIPTTQLQVYANVWAHIPILELSNDNRQYAIHLDPPPRFNRTTWTIITAITLTIIILAYLVVLNLLLHQVKKFFWRHQDGLETNEELEPVLLTILIWNVVVLLGELNIFVGCADIKEFPLRLKSVLFIIPFIYFLTRGIRCVVETRNHTKMKKEMTGNDNKCTKTCREILTTNWLIQANLFVTLEYLSASIVPASLLAYAYPTQVFATAALLTTGLIFCSLLALFARKVYYQTVKFLNIDRLPSLLSCCNKNRVNGIYYVVIVLYYIITTAVGISLIVLILATFDVAILKDIANTDGPYGTVLSFFPAIILSMLSWFLHKYKLKPYGKNRKTKSSTVIHI